MSEAKIQDFGEKIGGAKKDLWRRRCMTQRDLDTLTEREQYELVTKDNIWHKPDYVDLCNVMEPHVVYLQKKIRDAIPAKVPPKMAGREDSFQEYVYIVGRIRDLCEKITRDSMLKRLFRVAFDEGMDWDENDKTTMFTKRGGMWANLITNKTLFALQITDSMIKEAKKTIMETGWPNPQEAWMKSYRFEYDKGYFAITRVLFNGFTEAMFNIEFKTREEAVSYLKEYLERNGLLEKETRHKDPVRPVVDEVNRIGPLTRETDINEVLFEQAFPFRGFEFGNWASNKERQLSLNHAYDSFYDLAFVLGVPPQVISLKNTLAFAFGSRGSGTALAHYETTYKVINLTKNRGAGSLAHEWGHAFDDYLGGASGNRHITKPYISYGVSTRSNFPDELDDSIMQLLRSLYALNGATTRYYSSAKRLDSGKGKRYWSTNPELFARAFESYVYDKLAAAGRCNDYLVHGVTNDEYEQGNPYPEGRERAIINRNFDIVIHDLKRIGVLV